MAVDSEVLREILHRYRALNRWSDGRRVYGPHPTNLPGVVPVTADVLDGARGLLDVHPGLTAGAALHGAVVQTHSLDAICSYDRSRPNCRREVNGAGLRRAPATPPFNPAGPYHLTTQPGGPPLPSAPPGGPTPPPYPMVGWYLSVLPSYCPPARLPARPSARLPYRSSSGRPVAGCCSIEDHRGSLRARVVDVVSTQHDDVSNTIGVDVADGCLIEQISAAHRLQRV